MGCCYIADNEGVRRGKKDMVVWCKSTISLGLKMRWSWAKDLVLCCGTSIVYVCEDNCIANYFDINNSDYTVPDFSTTDYADYTYTFPGI